MERSALKALLGKHHKAFALNDEDIGYNNEIPHETVKTDDIPVMQPYWRITPSQSEEMKDHIRKLLHQCIIRPSKSPFASLIVFVWKKDDSLQMCVDYRRLNSKTCLMHSLYQVEKNALMHFMDHSGS